MLSDVGHPQPVRPIGLEAPADQIQRAGLADLRASREPALWQPVDPETIHDQRDLFSADVDAAAVAQLCCDPQPAVGASGVFMDLCDLAGEPGVPERPGRRRAALPVVIARLRDTEHHARLLHIDPLPGQRRDTG